MKAHLLPVSKQGENIYKLLLKSKQLNAKEIGNKLSIFPHAVYRAIKPLISAGLIEQIDTYPTTFQAQPMPNAVDSYFLNMRNSFIQSFSPNEINSSKNGLDISFIQKKIDLLNFSTEDINNSQKEVNHLVSGLEIPAETVLAIKNASERGVKIRFLVQQLNEVNKEMIKNWEKLGIEVKYYPTLEARIIIIDEEIIYITSYNPHKKNEATGVRFKYYPIAKIMSDIFEQKWALSTNI